MTTVPLPETPSLEQLRHQARDLQRAARAGEGDALALVAAHHPAPPAGPLPLHAAQLVIARRHRFPSWPRLVAHLAVVAEFQRVHRDVAAGADVATLFLDLACLTYAEDAPQRPAAAALLLAEHPEIADAGIHVAAACADVATVRQLLTADPELALAEGGPQKWPPLMHLAYARHDPDVSEAATVETARLLLAAGADPNAGFLFNGLPTPFTVLTGVFGSGEGDQSTHPHAIALAEVLLRAGADPNDGQALYNRMFRRDDSHLRLLFAHGLGTGDGGPWHRRMPDATDTPAKMLRDQLGWAVTHGMLDRIRLLAQHGVDLAAPQRGGRPAIELALLSGHPDAAALLTELGAPPPALDPVEALVAAAMAADGEQVTRIRAAHPEALTAALAQHPGLVVRAAVVGNIAAVRCIVGLGFDVSAAARHDLPIDQPWETALHVAAGDGAVALVRELLALGADPTVRDARFDATPLDWARHFEQEDTAALLGG